MPLLWLQRRNNWEASGAPWSWPLGPPPAQTLSGEPKSPTPDIFKIIGWDFGAHPIIFHLRTRTEGRIQPSTAHRVGNRKKALCSIILCIARRARHCHTKVRQVFSLPTSAVVDLVSIVFDKSLNPCYQAHGIILNNRILRPQRNLRICIERSHVNIGIRYIFAIVVLYGISYDSSHFSSLCFSSTQHTTEEIG